MKPFSDRIYQAQGYAQYEADDVRNAKIGEATARKHGDMFRHLADKYSGDLGEVLYKMFADESEKDELVTDIALACERIYRSKGVGETLIPPTIDLAFRDLGEVLWSRIFDEMWNQCEEDARRESE